MNLSSRSDNSPAALPTDRYTSAVAVAVREAEVINALIIREVSTRFGRENIGFAWIVVEPAMFAIAVIILWSLIGHNNGGHKELPIAPFLLCGYMPLIMYRHMVNRLMRCMQSNSPLLYHRQVTVFNLYVSRLIVELLGTSAAFAFSMIGFAIFGYVETPNDFSLMLGGWLMYAWYSAATGVLIGSLSERSDVVEKFWAPLSYIMVPLSGTFFMVDWLPPGFQDLILWSPPVNGTEMIRGGYFGATVATHYDISYFLYVNSFISLIGLFVMKNSREHVEIE